VGPDPKSHCPRTANARRCAATRTGASTARGASSRSGLLPASRRARFVEPEIRWSDEVVSAYLAQWQRITPVHHRVGEAAGSRLGVDPARGHAEEFCDLGGVEQGSVGFVEGPAGGFRVHACSVAAAAKVPTPEFDRGCSILVPT